MEALPALNAQHNDMELDNGPADARTKQGSVQSDADQLASRRRRTSLLGSGDSSSSGQDAQHIVERLFSTSNNGIVYLQSGMLRPEAVALLRDPGQRFSVAGTIELKNKILDDGPCIMLEFTVPASRALQFKHCPGSGDLHHLLAAPAPFEPSLFCTLLDLDQAERMLMTTAAPMWPAVN